MNFTIYSYRFSKEIIEHNNYSNGLDEIITIVRECPLFTWPGKSNKNANLNVVQQLLNAYFDVRFHNQNDWDYHPNATNIHESSLTADFRKTFGDLTIQCEVQFGNMSSWYSDIFKFQTAYSQNMINMGLSIVPFRNLANRIDSNITNFERCIREIESAKMSITLPILLIGLDADHQTEVINVQDSGFAGLSEITSAGNSDNQYRIIHAILNNIPIAEVSSASEIGNRP